MRTVEREGTGISESLTRTARTLSLALAASAGLLGTVHAAGEPELIAGSCGRISLLMTADEQLLAGAGAVNSGYALLALVAVLGPSEFAQSVQRVLGDGDSAGEGTGRSVAGSHSAVPGSGDLEVLSAGEGTGYSGDVPLPGTAQSNPVVNSAGEGTGFSGSFGGPPAPDAASGGPEVNSAGEGTGFSGSVPGGHAATQIWGWAEVSYSSAKAADVVIYREAGAGFDGSIGLVERGIFSNVAVSGLASGIGCDRE